MSDRLRELVNGRGVLRGIALFLIFSAAIFVLGWLLGVFDHDPADAGGVRLQYQAPTGERRY